jgi:hypothetical protein
MKTMRPQQPTSAMVREAPTSQPLPFCAVPTKLTAAPARVRKLDGIRDNARYTIRQARLGTSPYRDDIFHNVPFRTISEASILIKEISVSQLQTAIDALLNLLTQFGLAVATILTEFELWLRGVLQQIGVPHTLQTVLLLAVAAVLVLGSLRLFGGIIRIAVILVLLLIAIHIVMPVIQG